MKELENTTTLPCGCIYTRPSWSVLAQLLTPCEAHKEELERVESSKKID